MAVSARGPPVRQWEPHPQPADRQSRSRFAEMAHAPNHRSPCFGHKRRFHFALLPPYHATTYRSAKPAPLHQTCNSKCRNDIGGNVPQGWWQIFPPAPISLGCRTTCRGLIVGEVRSCPAGAPLTLKPKGRSRMGTHGVRLRLYTWSDGLSNSPDFPITGLFDMRLATASGNLPLPIVHVGRSDPFHSIHTRSLRRSARAGFWGNYASQNSVLWPNR
jgi:hypothetical protein